MVAPGLITKAVSSSGSDESPGLYSHQANQHSDWLCLKWKWNLLRTVFK